MVNVLQDLQDVEEEQGNNIMISIYIYAETRIVLR